MKFVLLIYVFIFSIFFNMNYIDLSCNCRSLSKNKSKDVKSNIKMDRVNLKRYRKGSLKNSKKPVENVRII